VQEADDGLLLTHLPTARAHALLVEHLDAQLKRPLQLSLNSAEESALAQRAEEWESLGLHLERFGGQSYRVHRVPDGLQLEEGSTLVTLIRSLLGSPSGQARAVFVEAMSEIPLNAKSRASTLKWIKSGGRGDPTLPPFYMTLNWSEVLKRRAHLSLF